MIRVSWLMMAVLMLAGGSALLNRGLFAQDEFDRGRALYENHCKSCHEALAHTRSGSQVHSEAELRERVASWSLHTGLNWSEDDVEDVTDYLNRHFYEFEEKI